MNNADLWKEIILTLGYFIISAVTAGFTVYKIFIAWNNQQIKLSNEFIDNRVNVQLKAERELIEKQNEKFKEKLEELENNYHKMNENSLRDMKEFLRNYK